MVALKSKTRRRSAVVESFIHPRCGPGSLCEDGLWAGGEIAAVFDCDSGPGVQETAAGAATAQALTGWAENARSPLDFAQAVAEMHDVVKAAARGEPVTAKCAVLDIPQRRAFSLGDVHVLSDGEPGLMPKETRAAAAFRSLMLSALIAGGADPEALAADDPAGPMVAEMLRAGESLRNKLPSEHGDDAQRSLGDWLFGYAALDGTATPAEMIDVSHEFDHGSEVVLATGGYPSPGMTLQASESALAAALGEWGGLMISPRFSMPQTAGRLPGASSCADRAFVRVAIGS